MSRTTAVRWHAILSPTVRGSHTCLPWPGDQDWVKFSVAAGANFLIAADNVTPGVAPLVTVFGGCDQVEAGNSLAGGGAPVQRSNATAAVYYARVTNQDPNSFGADRRYNLRVTVTACTADGSESDNSAGAARRGAVGQGVVHNVCPAGDEDSVKLTLDRVRPMCCKRTGPGLCRGHRADALCCGRRHQACRE